jgi:sugar phosphate isomerase/epimerase
MLRFAIQARHVPGDTLREQFALLASLGCEGIEISGDEAVEHRSALRRLMREYPVRISTTIGGYEGWLINADRSVRDYAIRQIGEILPVTAELGASGMITPASYGVGTRGALPGRRGSLTLEQEREILADALSQIGASAERFGGVLLLEPLNRYEDRTINTLAEAVAIISQVGSPSVRLMPDFFHMNIEEADIPASLRQFASSIGHVHVADSNRLPPGYGHIDFAAGLATLQETGYDAWLSIECSHVPGNFSITLPSVLTSLGQAAGQQS